VGALLLMSSLENYNYHRDTDPPQAKDDLSNLFSPYLTIAIFYALDKCCHHCPLSLLIADNIL